MSFVKKYAPLFAKGIGMGAADVVPGVSGGTIAFITGIYEKLIRSLKSFPAALIILVRTRNFRYFFNKVNGEFLLSVFAGIGIGIISLASIVKYFLNEHPVQLNGFFFGLIAASAVVIGKEITLLKTKSIIALLVGTGITYYISIAAPSSTPDSLWFIFLSGTIAISAMILPGISGSFILLLMGKYQTIIEALSNLEIQILLVFIGGCVIGLFTFAQFLSVLFKNHKNATMSLLTGFLVGSLAKVWPWKKVLETRINSKGMEVPLIEENILPVYFLGDPQIILTSLLAIAGTAVVLILHRSNSMKQKNDR